MSFPKKNVSTKILILQFYLMHIRAMDLIKPIPLRRHLDEMRCNEKMEFFGENSDALSCIKHLILNCRRNDGYHEYITEYYKSFNDNLDTDDIDHPEVFCKGKDKDCRKFLNKFGDTTLSAARYALYETKLYNYGASILNSRSPETSFRSSSRRFFNGIQPGVCGKGAALSRSEKKSFRLQLEEDIQNDYIIHIKDKIKLTNNQKSPSEFCSYIVLNPLINPNDRDGSRTDSGDLFELNDIPN